MSKKKRIGIIMGGISSEREISIRSGEGVISKIDMNKYEVCPIRIDKKEDILNIDGIDFALLMLHGALGEDGTIQSVLGVKGIPYSGCGPLSSAMCMDKNITKRILRDSGLSTANWITVKSIEEIDYDAIEKIGYPVFIKPNSGGSSVATYKVHCKEEVENAIREGLVVDKEVIIEQFVQGDEISCPVVDGKVYPTMQIKPTGEFFDMSSKYSCDGAVENVASFADKLQSKIDDLARKTYKALNCEVYARIDMIVSNGEPFILEVNTLPGMTSTSLFPQSLASVGVSYIELIDMIIDKSLEVNR